MKWQTVPLSDVLENVKPGFACGENPSDGVFQFRMNNVTTEGTLDFSKRRRVPRTTRGLESYLLQIGDVLFNATNSPDLVGKSVFFSGLDEPVVFSNHFLRLRPARERLDSRFLAHWLKVQFQHRVFAGMCRQWVNQATVSRDSLLALKIPLPTLREQHRIAEALDRAETLRAQRRSVIARLDELGQAIFVDLFGNAVANPKRWPTAHLWEVAKVTTGGTPPGERSGMFGGKIPFVTPGDLGNTASTKRTLTESGAHESRIVRAGASLVCCIGATIGKMAMTRFASAFNQQINAVEWNEIVDDRYGFAALQSLKALIVARGTSTTLPILKKSTFENFVLPVPPIDLQRAFARRIDMAEALRTRVVLGLQLHQSLYVSLQHLAFRGEL